MNPRLVAGACAGLLALPFPPPHPAPALGGWAVISVEDLPDYAVPGRPLELVFTIRQHGVEPMAGLEPTVEIARGSEQRRVAAAPTDRKGVYRARLAFPSAGDWAVTINSGFGPSRVTLVPITAIAAAGALPTLPEAERGRRLFAAKGCVACHRHAEVPVEKHWGVGPDLTGRRYPVEALRQRLTDPKAALPESKMPDPDLKPAEIAALTAFINRAGPAVR